MAWQPKEGRDGEVKWSSDREIDYKARTLLKLSASRYRTRVVSDTRKTFLEHVWGYS